MATAAGTPVQKSTALTSSPAAGAGSPGADLTSKVALARMTETPSSSGTALTGDASADYNFQKHLEDAESKLLEGNKETALSMFSEIKGRIEKAKLPQASFFPLRCLLGLMNSSTIEDEKHRYFADFLKTLVPVYASRKNWLADDTSSAHSELRWLLNKFRLRIPKNQSLDLLIGKVDGMIAECAKHILPIDAFYEMVKEADEAVKTKDLKLARALYKNALALIADKFQIEFEVARGTCLLKLTGTYQKDEPDRANMRNQAQEAIFSLFTKRASLYEAGKYTRVDAFKLLISYLRSLRLLTLDSIVNYNAIQNKINACKEEIPEELLKSKTPASDPHRRVTPGSPDGSWSLGRLFIAVVCAALAVASVALYQRYSVKLI